MFGFFKRLIHRKSETQSSIKEPSEGTAPGTEIHYHSDLVPELLNDHQILLKHFGEIVEAEKRGEFHRLPDLLEEFGSVLRGHLLKENVKLYIYLQHALANDPDNAVLMQGFRTEMHGISRTVTKFLKRYGQKEWDRQRREQFGADLDKIGEVLVRRIQTEEEVLYPLYLPPESYS